MRWSNNVLTDAKVRASYGITGNDKIGRYESQMFIPQVLNIIIQQEDSPASKYGNPEFEMGANQADKYWFGFELLKWTYHVCS